MGLRRLSGGRDSERLTRNVNFAGYEHRVARILQDEGWQTTVAAPGRDGGVDVIAEKAGRRLGVQVKMYGSGRPVNAQIVRELFGAASERDCNEFMIATDGRLTQEAHTAADKLGVQVRLIPATGAVDPRSPATTTGFDDVWRKHVVPLQGRTLTRKNGSTNEILKVHGGGVLRRTSGGDPHLLKIEIFRWTVERLLAGHTVTRKEINERYTGRGSSGVYLILASAPIFGEVRVGGLMALKLSAKV